MKIKRILIAPLPSPPRKGGGKSSSTPQAAMRELMGDDSSRLAEFLGSLTPDVFQNWNRFGFSLTKEQAKEIAAQQCQLPASQEKGFLAFNDKGEVVGYSYLRFFPEKKTKSHTVSLGIVVSSKYQGKGIGKQLMLFMHHWAQQQGVKKIWLGTYTSNKNALYLYRSLGYEIEGIFMYDELSPRGWDHVVSMALMLDKRFKNAQKERQAIIHEFEGRA